jgi:hypothetical protein
MTIPGASETIQDGGLGLSEPASVMAYVYGVSSLGTQNEVALYSDANVLKSERGEGPAVELAAALLDVAGPIGFISADPSIASAISDVDATYGTTGSESSVTRSGGTTGPAISVAGANPEYSASFKIEITTGGVRGTAAFRWSNDGGSTWVQTGVLTAATVVLPGTGITVTFPSGTYVLSEAYAWTSTAGGGTLTASGTPTLDAHVRVEILLGGDNGTARFRYSVDGYSGDTVSERTYSENLTVPSGGTFVITGLGVTLTFDDTVPFVAGDIYEFDTECEAWNATDLDDAFTAIGLSSGKWRFIAAATSKASGDAAAHAVLGAALQSQLDALAASSKYRRGMLPADQDDDDDAVVTAFQNVSAARCLFAFGRVKRVTTKPFPGFAQPVTHSVDVFARRAAKSLLSTDLKRVRSGALSEVLKLFHDDYKSPTLLDDGKISTLRTYEGRGGFYITQARLKSDAGSDFKLWPHGVLMDVACETAHDGFVEWIGSEVRTTSAVINGNTYQGVIDERDAKRVEEEVSQKLVDQLITPVNAEGFKGYVTAVRLTIDRTHNVLSTGTILYTVGIKPHGYVDFINGTFGYLVSLPSAA